MSAEAPPPQEFDLTLPGFSPGALEGLGDSAFDDVPASEAIDVGDLEGDPALAFRRTLGMFATGVTVLTTRKGDQVHGMTANAFMSVSLRPPLVLISLDRRARMCAMLHEGTHFGVSVLAQGQAELSDKFAGRAVDAEADFVVVGDTPLVGGALAHLVARVVRSYWGGDHSLFLGHVEYARYGSGRPLLFHGGRYEKLVDEPQAVASLPAELREALAARGTPRSYPAGATLMAAGDPGQELLLLLQGSALVERPGVSLAIGPGEVAGELEVLAGGARRLATVTAVEDVSCVALSRADLRAALVAEPDVAWALLELLASRFRDER